MAKGEILMTLLTTVWSYFWAIITILPIVGFFLVYGIMYAWKREHRKALHWSVTVTNLLLIQAVVAAYGIIWPTAWSAWWWVILLFTGVAGLLGWLQHRKRGRISARKIGLSTWRITFILFGLAYMVLFGAGIWKNMQLG